MNTKYTEKEQLSNSLLQTNGLVSVIKKGKTTINEIGDLVPGYLHLNFRNTYSINYLNKSGQEHWSTDVELIRSKGLAWLDKFCEPNVLKNNKLKIKNFNESAQPSEILTYFQLMRISIDQPFQWYFTSKQIFNEIFHISITLNITSMRKDIVKIGKMIDEDPVANAYFNKFHSLSKREKEILRYVAKGHSSQRIADTLFISIHTVQTHRKNIWNKLDINSYSELIKIAQAFNMVPE